jgi:hypothetical protein
MRLGMRFGLSAIEQPEAIPREMSSRSAKVSANHQNDMLVDRANRTGPRRGPVANSESTAVGRRVRPGLVNMGICPLAMGRKTARWATRNPCSDDGESAHSRSFAVSRAPFFTCSSWEGFWMLSCASWKPSATSEGSKKSKASAPRPIETTRLIGSYEAIAADRERQS